MTLVELFSEYMSSLQTILDPVTVILGYPALGRPDVVLPIAALTFADDDYGRTTPAQIQQRRVGQSQPLGRSVRAAVSVFANNERELLTLLDTMQAAKADLTGLMVNGTRVTVAYQVTQRLPFDTESPPPLRYATETVLLFNWSI